MTSLLLPFPPTRINDGFINCNPAIDFQDVGFIKKDPLIHGSADAIAGDLSYRFNEADFYQYIGVDIVAETAFEYPYCFITEKTYRSFACLRPFILVGPYNSLNFIKSFGFQTFSAIIDESYDVIQLPEERFLKVCDSIETFINRPIENIQEDIKRIEATLLHNQRTLFNLTDSELESLKSKFK